VPTERHVAVERFEVKAEAACANAHGRFFGEVVHGAIALPRARSLTLPAQMILVASTSTWLPG
jgi:hypothetical protein